MKDLVGVVRVKVLLAGSKLLEDGSRLDHDGRFAVICYMPFRYTVHIV